MYMNYLNFNLGWLVLKVLLYCSVKNRGSMPALLAQPEAIASLSAFAEAEFAVLFICADKVYALISVYQLRLFHDQIAC